MKINTVCKKTGMTERTIRFYIEKGLLQTQSQVINGRINRNFSEEDVSVLVDIAKLRKAGFSVQDILDMQHGTKDTMEIVQEHCRNLEEKQKFDNQLIMELQDISKRGNISWRKLANVLFRPDPKNKNAAICYPLEDKEIDDILEQRSLARFKRGIKLTVVLLLIILLIIPVRYAWHNAQILTSSFSICEVIVCNKWRDAEGRQYVSIYSNYPDSAPEKYFKIPQTILIDSSDYYNTLLIESKPYASFEIWIEVPRGDAKVYKLLNDNGSIRIDKVLSNKTFIEKYCVIERIDADGEQ